MKRFGVLAIAVAVLASACSSDPPDAAPATTGTSPGSTVASSTVTSAPATTTSSATSTSQAGTTSTTAAATSTTTPAPAFSATITRTSYGIPHIVAANWGSLGFGQGYAFAQDRACTLIDQVIKVRGERSKWFGPGTDNANVNTDFAYRQLGLHDDADTRFAHEPQNVADTVAGYVAGFDAELAKQGPSGWCAGQPWVQPITTTDLWAYLNDVLLFASSGVLIDQIATAQPPTASSASATSVPATSTPATSTPATSTSSAGAALPDRSLTTSLASNGWAIGSQLSESGGGMLLANPHFPWEGEKRLWESQLTLTNGALNVYGASLSGVPGVLIGFNDHVAWTHTTSAGYRMTLYQLNLVPGDPTSYVYGTTTKHMTSQDITIQVKQSDGSTKPMTRTMWRSHYGPMLNLPFGWTTGTAFTYRDANLDNTSFLQQFLGMDAATSMDDFINVHRTANGIPWVNTMAVSSDGRAWYADTAATPDLSPQAIAAWQAAVAGGGLANTVLANGAILLNGSDPTNEWVDDPTAARPGILPFSQQPQLERTDFVFNSNDSHWLANPSAPLTGYSPLTGPEGVAQSARTRENALMLTDPTLRGADGKFTIQNLQQALFSNRSLPGSLLLPGVLADCDTKPLPKVQVDAKPYDLTAACAALHDWDGRDGVASKGAALWREFMNRYSYHDQTDKGALYNVAFDPKNPILTPNTLNPDRAAVLTNLATAAKLLTDAGFTLDEPLGQMQFDDRVGNDHIAVPGGTSLDGTASVVDCCSGSNTLAPMGDPGTFSQSGAFSDKGYPVSNGDSFIMTMAFTKAGPQAQALLTYGQPDDPTDPNFTSQMKLFSASTFRPVDFTSTDVAKDATSTVTVTGS